jgi:zinc finger-containing ubiquitin peptidase 1
METLHPEGEEDSPFVVKGDDVTDSAKADEDLPYAECPVDGCGELLPFDAMDYHIELHAAEAGADLDGETGQSPNRDLHTGGSSSSGPSRAHRDAERQRRAESSQAKAISAWKRLLRMPESSSSSASSSHSSKHHHRKDPKSSAPSDQGRGKRLGVSAHAVGTVSERLSLTFCAESAVGKIRPRRSHAGVARLASSEWAPG